MEGTQLDPDPGDPGTGQRIGGDPTVMESQFEPGCSPECEMVLNGWFYQWNVS